MYTFLLLIYLLLSNKIIKNAVIILLIKMYNNKAIDIWFHRNVVPYDFFNLVQKQLKI